MNSTNCDKKSGEILSQKLVDGYQNHLIEVQHYWRYMYILSTIYLLLYFIYLQIG